jgi:hypothetical protein
MTTERSITRRDLLFGAVGVPALFHINRAARPTDIRIEDVSYTYQKYKFRVPIKFGGRVGDELTLINVDCAVQTARGEVGKGFGSMPLSNVWAFPSETMSYETTLGAMKTLAGRISKITGNYKEIGHPIDINCTLEPEYLKAAAEVAEQLNLAEPIPKLATLATASAFDAAVHDAFGKAHGLNCYRTYDREFMVNDLGHYLGPTFKGEGRSIMSGHQPPPRIRIFLPLILKSR